MTIKKAIKPAVTSVFVSKQKESSMVLISYQKVQSSWFRLMLWNMKDQHDTTQHDCPSWDRHFMLQLSPSVEGVRGQCLQLNLSEVFESLERSERSGKSVLSEGKNVYRFFGQRETERTSCQLKKRIWNQVR